MKERPILFSAPMVRALLDGSKTQTRRVCKPAEAAALSHVVGIQDPRDFGQRPLEVPGSGWFGDEEGDVQFRSPYGRPGDRLWVRETWAHDAHTIEECRAALEDAMGGIKYGPYYRATEEAPETLRWHPSIHMPRWASRILLEIVSVRVERLQDISDEDCLAEGVHAIEHEGDGTYYHHERTFADPGNWCHPDLAYKALWESINGVGSWAANPWVWVIDFKRVQP